MTLAAAKDVVLWSLFRLHHRRFAGTALMFRFDPSTLLAIFAGGGSIATAIAAANGGITGVQCLVAASFFLSIVFPDDFRQLHPRSRRRRQDGLGNADVAAGSGAAVLALLNIVTTPATVQYVMAVPSLCFAPSPYSRWFSAARTKQSGSS